LVIGGPQSKERSVATTHPYQSDCDCHKPSCTN
jgi:hypothetical protein